MTCAFQKARTPGMVREQCPTPIPCPWASFSGSGPSWMSSHTLWTQLRAGTCSHVLWVCPESPLELGCGLRKLTVDPPQMVLSARPYFLWHPAFSRGLVIVLRHAALSWADGWLLEIKGSATPPSS